MTNKPEPPETLRGTGDESEMKLIKYELEDWIWARIQKKVVLIGSSISFILVLLGYFGYNQFIDLRTEARRYVDETKQQKDELENFVREFKETVLPEYREKIAEHERRQRLVAFKEYCESTLETSEIAPWFKQRFGRDMKDVESKHFDKYLRRFNVCNLEQLREVYEDESQKEIERLFEELLGRKPRPFGQFVWGIQLMHGYTEAQVREEIQNSAEARNRRSMPRKY